MANEDTTDDFFFLTKPSFVGILNLVIRRRDERSRRMPSMEAVLTHPTRPSANSSLVQKISFEPNPAQKIKNCTTEAGMCMKTKKVKTTCPEKSGHYRQSRQQLSDIASASKRKERAVVRVRAQNNGTTDLPQNKKMVCRRREYAGDGISWEIVENTGRVAARPCPKGMIPLQCAAG